MIKPFMRFQYGVWICRTSRDDNSFLSWYASPINAYIGWVEAKEVYEGLK